MTRTHSFRVSGAIPSVLLRVLLVVCGGGAVLVLNAYPVWQVLGVAAFVFAAAFPRSLANWAGMACILVGLITTDPTPVRTATAVLAVHAVQVLGALSLTIPARGWLDLRALGPTVRRFVLIQVIAQPLALLVLVLPTVGESGAAWLAPIGAIALATVAVLAVVLPRREDRRSAAEAGSGAAEPGVGGPS